MRAETALQSQVWAYLQIQERLGRLVAVPVPNGTQVAGSTKAERARRIAFLKHVGLLRPGALDLLVMFPDGKGVWIELKAGPKTDYSADQMAFTYALHRISWPFELARSLADVQAIIEPLMRRAAA